MNSLPLVLGIIGAFITLGLGINAFFLRGIYTDLNDVKVEIAKIFTNSEAKELRIRELEQNQKELYDKINDLRDRVHSLEGGQKQLLAYLDDRS